MPPSALRHLLGVLAARVREDVLAAGPAADRAWRPRRQDAGRGDPALDGGAVTAATSMRRPPSPLPTTTAAGPSASWSRTFCARSRRPPGSSPGTSETTSATPSTGWRPRPATRSARRGRPRAAGRARSLRRLFSSRILARCSAAAGRVVRPERLDEAAQQGALGVDLDAGRRVPRAPRRDACRSRSSPRAGSRTTRDVAGAMHVGPAAQLAWSSPRPRRRGRCRRTSRRTAPRRRGAFASSMRRLVVARTSSSMASRRFASSSASSRSSPRDGVRMAEVEPQPAGRDQRTGLPRVLAEQLLERPVHDVRGGVGARGRLAAAPRRSRACGLLAGADLARRDDAHVHRWPPAPAGMVSVTPNHAGGGPDQSLVADLTAALRVERRAIEEDADRLRPPRPPQLGGIARRATARSARRPRGPWYPTNSVGGTAPASRPIVDLLRGRARTVALLLEQLGEPVGVDRRGRLRPPSSSDAARAGTRTCRDSLNAASPEIARSAPPGPWRRRRARMPCRRVAENRSSSESAT